MLYAQHSMQRAAHTLLGSDLMSPDDYLMQRLEWRKRQTDTVIRALAYDYRVGLIDECTSDAWDEYMVRFGPNARGPQQESVKRTRNRASTQSSKRRRKVA